MRAIVFHERGGLDVLKLEDVAQPTPGPGQALVRVEACGLNRLDTLVRTGRAGPNAPMPHIGGSEAAGVLAALGPGAERDAAAQGAHLGRRVAVAPYLCCGECEMCLAGNETLCLKGDILGLHSQGAFAEYVVVPANSLVPLPEGMASVTAAAAGLAMLTAWHMLSTRARLTRGETVLVQAAGSGVGSAAIGIARYVGARVIATVGEDRKLDRARQLGADEVFNYRTTDIVKTVRQLTDRRGADVVVEHVGQDTFAASVGALARRGRLVSCGATTGDDGRLNLWSFFAKELTLMGAYGGTRDELADVLRLIHQQHLAPVVDRTVPLEGIPAGERALDEREVFGKIVAVIERVA